MSFSGFPELNINDLTMFYNNFYGDNSVFDEFNWNSLDAGPSQPYMGVDVQGDLNNYPEFLSPNSAPISLYPTHGVSTNEGKSSYILVVTIRRLTFWSQDTSPHFTRARPRPLSRHNRRTFTPPRPLPPPPLPHHPSQPFRTVVSTFPSPLWFQLLTCYG